MKRIFPLAVVCLLACASASQAQLFRRFAGNDCPDGRCPTPQASARAIVAIASGVPSPVAVALAKKTAPPAVKEAQPLPAVQPATRAVPPAVRFAPPAVTVRAKAVVRQTVAAQPVRTLARGVLLRLTCFFRP